MRLMGGRRGRGVDGGEEGEGGLMGGRRGRGVCFLGKFNVIVITSINEKLFCCFFFRIFLIFSNFYSKIFKSTHYFIPIFFCFSITGFI